MNNPQFYWDRHATFVRGVTLMDFHWFQATYCTWNSECLSSRQRRRAKTSCTPCLKHGKCQNLGFHPQDKPEISLHLKMYLLIFFTRALTWSTGQWREFGLDPARSHANERQWFLIEGNPLKHTIQITQTAGWCCKQFDSAKHIGVYQKILNPNNKCKRMQRKKR